MSKRMCTGIATNACGAAGCRLPLKCIQRAVSLASIQQARDAIERLTAVAWCPNALLVASLAFLAIIIIGG
jgi:hypothetical protein